MKELGKLSVSKIRGLTDERSFEKGVKYCGEGHITEPVLTGSELRAYCQGTQNEPYRVTATLSKDGVAKTSCTCPRGGVCKHIVALLLAYVDKPDAFSVQQPLEAALAVFTREELVSLIAQMCKKEPDLTSLVDLASLQKQGKAGAETYRRAVSKALRHGPAWRIENELRTLLDKAGELAKAGQWLEAGALYDAVLSEAVGCYGNWLHDIDEDGNIAILVDEAAEGVTECLRKGKLDPKTRSVWLDSLLEAVLADVELGGIDLAPAAEDALLKYVMDEEWEPMRKRIQSKIDAIDASERFFEKWGRGALQEFLAEREKKQRRTRTKAAATAKL